MVAERIVVSLSIIFVLFMLASPVMASPQIEWLKNQQDLYTTGLLDSHEGDGNRWAYIYDQAVAVIAFTSAGELDRARKLLDKMEALQHSDGWWYECYDAYTSKIGHWGCDIQNTGPIAWMVMAINFYEAETKDNQYASMAEKALEWLENVRVTNPADREYGSLKYCKGNRCTIPFAVSTEHNHDAYSAYLWMWRLSGNSEYKKKANLVRDYLIREVWRPDINMFWRGFNDPVNCTDTQSWGVLSLGPTGPNGEELYKSLDWLYYDPKSTRNQQDYNSTVLNVDGFEDCTDSPDHIWLEATEGVAAAFHLIGDDTRGDYFHNHVGRVASPDGGVIHSFTETDPNNIRWHENFRRNAVAGASWRYFTENGINPFRPDFTIIGDVDGNCIVNIFDLAAVGLCYGKSTSGDCQKADLTGDGKVDIFDLATIGLNYGISC